MKDTINPQHYKNHPSKIEAIQITEHLDFCLGNAVKYCFRSGNKVQSDATEDLRKAVWYAERELESVLGGRKIRSLGPWPCSDPSDRQDQETCAYQEWIHDVAFFFSAKASLRTRNGSRDFYWGEAERFGCLPLEWGSDGQPVVQSNLGASVVQHAAEKITRHGTAGGQEMVREVDRGASKRSEIQYGISDRYSESNWCVTRSGMAYPFRKELAAYIAHEPQEWRKRVVFYLATREPVKALWYLNKLIEELESHGINSREASKKESDIYP